MNRLLMRQFTLLTLCFFVTATSVIDQVAAQTEEMAVADKIKDLETQLSATDIESRDDAEKQIIAFGSEALDYIGDPSEDHSDDLNQRLNRIRKTLEKVAIDEAVTPSSITLSGEMSIKQAIDSIKAQSGNVVEMAEGYDPALLEKQVDFDLSEASFWEAFSEILNSGRFATDAYAGVAGKAILVPLPPIDPAEIDQAAKHQPAPLDQNSIFRIRVVSVSSVKNFVLPALNYTRINLEIQWEPRLKPISIDLPLSDLKVTDADGKPLEVSNPQQVLSGPVQAGINQVEMSLTLASVPREIKSIGSITGKLDCILPGRQEKFRFPPIGEIEDTPEVSKAGMTVQYMGFEKNEDLYAVGVMITMDESSGSFDSHLGWVYDNPLYLIDDVGNKEPSIGQQGGDINNNGVVIQYFFVDDPAKKGLLYESPGAIVPFPAQFKLQNIALP